ncbi:MAG: hypothetical protein AB7G93_16810 [Bdellovibrionales bacterium]
MASESYAKFIQKCEEDIRSGHLREVVARLRELTPKRVPRDHRLALANLCRRVGLVQLGLALLGPVVRPSNPRQSLTATPQELAEYAVLLHRDGVVYEPIEILRQIDPAQAPEALLYQSFCWFNLWDYAKAVPLLERYVKSNISPYMELVGGVNLAAATIGAQEYDKAEIILSDLVGKTERSGLVRLQGNCLELLAQIRFYQTDFAGCKMYLQQAHSLLESSPTADVFFVKKWRRIVEALENKDPAPLESLRIEAIARGEWESVRVCDCYQLKIRFDQEKFEHLLFGTPFPNYRNLLCRELGIDLYPREFLYGKGHERIFDFVNGEHRGVGAFLDSGKCVQLVEVLLRDFYRPQRLGALFSDIYAGEYFDIVNSPNRMHQLFSRTRRLLEQEALPIRILEKNGAYRLRIEGPVSFRLPLERKSIDTYHTEVERLRRAFEGSATFSASQARSVLNIPRTTFQRIVNWAREQGTLTTVGKGSSTQYRFVPPKRADSRAA